jgi:hypothetical protein
MSVYPNSIFQAVGPNNRSLFRPVASAVLGFSFLGHALRNELDPRTRLKLGL